MKTAFTKGKSKLHIHKISRTKHARFLEQERQDSITHEMIQEGDEVVFCKICKSVFTVDSWEYIGRSHCNQTETLRSVPMLKALSLDKNKITRRKRTAFIRKHYTGILISLTALLGVLGMLGMGINALTAPASSMKIHNISITEKHYIKKGEAFHNAKNYVKAGMYYKKALQINPQNTEARHHLEQLENEYLLALEQADKFYKTQGYQKAKYWYRKATSYKPNSEYPKKQLGLITKAEAEAPSSFTLRVKLSQLEERMFLQPLPNEWRKFINKKEKLHFWVQNLNRTEVLLSYQNGLVELRSTKTEEKSTKTSKKEFGKLLNTFKGDLFPQAVFVYNDFFLNTFAKYSKEKLEYLKNTLNYGSISVLSKDNKIYYYALDHRGARQVKQFSTFKYEEGQEVIFSPNGKYFLIQGNDKLLHLYDNRSKTLLKSLRTEEHLPFTENAYFDLENNQIVAKTAKGESRWNI